MGRYENVACQLAPLVDDIAIMKRMFLALILALTVPLLATAPVASLAMAGTMLCENMALSDVPTDHVTGHATDHTGHADHAAHAMPKTGTDTANAAGPICCDHACVAEVPVLTMDGTQSRATSALPRSWTVAGLTELAHPAGLRRPPKA